MIQSSLEANPDSFTEPDFEPVIPHSHNPRIKRLERLIAEIPQWIWETDSHDRIVFSNPNIFEITGYTPSEIIETNLFDLLLPLDYNELEGEYLVSKLKRRNDQPIAINHRMRHRDNSIHYLKTKIIANFDNKGIFTGYLGITFDRTAQLFVERSLRETEKNMELVLANLTEVVYRLDERFYITFVSPAIEVFFNVKPEEILGKPFNEIFKRINHKPNIVESISDMFEHSIQNHLPEMNYELEIDTDKNYCVYYIVKKILYDSNNNYLGVIGSIRDITTTKKAEANMHAAFNGTIDAIAEIVEQRDVYTSGHQRNVSKLSVAIAKEIGLEESRIEGLRIAAMLHDVGKVSIPTEILTRPTRLNEPERRIIEMHSKLGANILRQVPFPWLIARFVEEHHERIDGSGYPYGLKGEEISLEARIIGVADSLDSLLNHRPYKPAQDIDTALRIILENRGIKFDKDVVDAVILLYKKNFFESYILNIAQLFR
jgi:putative nucleotidyltransferase with HDIG domain/PAS domain S-box-containing protein